MTAFDMHPIDVHPLAIAADPAFQAGGQDASALFDRLAVKYDRDIVGRAWVAACLAYDQLGGVLHDEPDPAEVANVTAHLVPQRGPDERPMVQIGDAQVFVYFDDGILRVNVVTEQMPGQCVQVDVDDTEVWSR